VYADGRVLVVDLDAHQGNGTAAVFHDWDWAWEDYPLPVASGLTGGTYLGIVRDTLPGAFNAVRPDLVVYNAGSAPDVDNPLAPVPAHGGRFGQAGPAGNQLGPGARDSSGDGPLRGLLGRIPADSR
jgi:acetoin utilization deacetylase AcuC-like enzyme